MNLVYCSQGHPNPAGNRFCQHCGEPMLGVNPRNLPNGVTLGDRYRIVRELGKGGFGQTYLAQDLNRFHELCVLKEFAPQVQGDYALQKSQELFEREAGVLYKLQHPQIPRFRELFRVAYQGEERLFLVQDYVDGQTYQALLNTRKQQGIGFTEAEVVELFEDILPVLHYIHALWVVHRDISPDNLILRTQDRKPVLIDFGGVKEVAVRAELQYSPAALAGQSTIIPTRLGKAGYAPREQMQRGVVSAQSDLYALAATALALLTGKEPQELIDNRTLSWHWSQIGHISPKFQGILEKMLQPIPSDRYQSAQEVLQALDDTQGHPLIATVAHTPEAPVVPIISPVPTPAEPNTGATFAVVPPATSAVSASVTPKRSHWGCLGKTLLWLLVIASAGAIGWWAGSWWIRSQVEKLSSSPTPTLTLTPTTSPTATPTSSSTPVDNSEAQRQQALQQRRQNLGIELSFYEELVNQAFENLKPEQKGKVLGNTPEEASLRADRDKIANDLLNQIEQVNLTSQVRKDLGTYNSADRKQWTSRVNRLRLSSRSLTDLANGKFAALLPQYTAKTLNLDFDDWLKTPVGQLWYAIAADIVPTLEAKTALETVVFDPGATSKQLNGTLKLGEGKAYIAQLAAGQLMQLKLEAPDQVLISVYSPSGQVQILEDSPERNWSGTLPESGFYELVIISNAPETTNYQLDLTVNDTSPVTTPTPSVSPAF
ncbi:protein kinase domain-containing protein [Merismopedia glauca]|uniref:non-specific serine/threonine protein kinase n=1 Tax=Merismopedia glauca CCAP 1448/3 TaxID=1296344 RepID=A0A2T1C2P7_9CYAN|nr:protein kinase [Merismopedia glauca]PSB02546.1 serine/threonine protein kinase [Merismopedia glauca CCAP 1448/3]